MVSSDLPGGDRFRFALLLMGLGSLASTAVAQEPVQSRAQIHTCILNGKRLTSDRVIPDCSGVEQRVLNSDGSLNRVIAPALTEEQRSEADARIRQEEINRAERNKIVRSDRNLMQQFPSETEHRKSREKSLDDARKSLINSRERITLLMGERKPLLDEAEFYVGKPQPLKLKRQLDANDAALEAQKALIQNQENEIKRINDREDVVLSRLRKLWGGAAPGSMGPLDGVAQSRTNVNPSR